MKPKSDKIYVIFVDFSDNDYVQHNVCAFMEKEDAQEYCASAYALLRVELEKEPQEQDFQKFNFSDDLIDDLRHWYKRNDFPSFNIDEIPLNPPEMAKEFDNDPT